MSFTYKAYKLRRGKRLTCPFITGRIITDIAILVKQQQLLALKLISR